MRKLNTSYVVVGLFIVAMLAAALVSASLFAGRVGARETYHTLLDNVADVTFGTQVRYEGYPIGQVEAISPVAEGARMRFRVALSVERGWRIPADSVARIGSTSLLAAKTIDIESGRAETVLAAGGEIPSGAPNDAFAAMSSIAAEFGDLNRDGLTPLVDRVATLVERTGADLHRDLAHLLGTLNTLAAAMEQRAPAMFDQVAVLIERLDSSAAGLEQILSQDNAAAIDRLLGHAESTGRSLGATSRELAQTVVKVDRLIGNLDGLVADNRSGLDRSVEDVQYTLGSIARNIDTIIHNLEGSSRNMNEFSRLIRQNPGLLLGGAPREEIPASYGRTNGVPQ